MAVHIITGYPGAGKGYVTTAIAARFLKQGQRVFANYPMEGVEVIRSRDELLRLPSSVIFIDEAQDWFDARDWANLSREQRYKWTKTRKAGWELYLMTQDVDQLDKRIRNVAHYLYRVRPSWKALMILGTDYKPKKGKRGVVFVPFKDRHPLYFTVEKWHVKDFEKQNRKPIARRRFWFRWKIADRYNTLWEEPPEDIRERVSSSHA